MKKFTQEVAEKNSKILNKIRQLREEKRYSREEMAEKLGMDTSTYTRIENGLSRPKIGLQLFCQFE